MSNQVMAQTTSLQVRNLAGCSTLRGGIAPNRAGCWARHRAESLIRLSQCPWVYYRRPGASVKVGTAAGSFGLKTDECSFYTMKTAHDAQQPLPILKRLRNKVVAD